MLLALKRTGPYIPPITFPGLGDVVLTSDARKQLLASQLIGFSFVPVEKSHIVELHWEQWNFTAEEPDQYPDSGEPEDYILSQPHSDKTAAALGELWELVVPPTVEIVSNKELEIAQSTWGGDDLFRSNSYGSLLCTERARDWFSRQWGKYLEFVEVHST